MGETETATKIVPNPNHPARFSEPILDLIGRLVADETARLRRRLRLIDVFGGVGRIHDVDADTVHGDLELGWAACRRPSVLADATVPPFRRHAFDGYVCSPAYGSRAADHYNAQDSHKACGGNGCRTCAFSGLSPRKTYRVANGGPLHPRNSGQMPWGCVAPGTLILRGDLRWVRAENLEVGDPIIGVDEVVDETLSASIRQRGRRWRTGVVEAIEKAPRECVEIEFDDGWIVVCTTDHPWLVRRVTSAGGQRRQLYWTRAAILRTGDELPVLMPWFAQAPTYEAGWLGGIYDGEGSLSSKCSLKVSQKPGPTLDRIKQRLGDFGFDFRHHSDPNADALTLLGGVGEVARLLGTVRPERLIAKFSIDGRGIRTTRVRTVARVRQIGQHPVMLMGTSIGTYLADGMASHNTRYKDLHRQAWAQISYLVRPGGLVVVNVSNHIRGGVEQPVVEWHLGQLRRAGLLFEDLYAVPTRRYRNGANRDARVAHEHIIVMRTPAA